MKKLCSLLLWLAPLAAASAQQLDPGFRPGEVLQPGSVTQVVEQPDGGRVVVGRFSWVDQVPVANVVRYLPRGSGLDYAYLQRLGGVSWSYNFPAAKPLGGGRLLLHTAGPITTPSLTRWAMMALTAAGRPDSTFDAALGTGHVQTVLVQPDGNILIAGQFTQAGGQLGAAQLVRLLPNGQRDASFVAPPFAATFGSLNLHTLALQPDGKILVGGEFASPARALVRLLPNGSLDPSFSVVTAGSTAVVHQLAVQPDGKILVGGRTTNTVAGRTAGLLRLLSTGALDAGFQAPAGLDCYGSAGSRQLEVLADGRIVVQGGPYGSYRVARLLPNGGLDGSFALNTALTYPDYMPLYTNTRLANGNWLLGGAFTAFGGQRGSVIEFTPDGQPVRAPRPLVSDPGLVTTLALQPDGKILVGGSFSWLNGAPADNIGRLLPNGEADTLFNARCAADAVVYKIGLLPSGEVLAGGSFRRIGGLTTTGLARLSAAGQPDAQFQPFPTPAGSTSLVADVTTLLPLPNGDVLAGGRFNNSQHTLVRVNGTGQLLWGLNLSTVRCLARQPDGNILAAGSRLTRLLPSGQTDPSLQYAASPSELLRDLAVQPDGRILLTGQVSHNGTLYRLGRVLSTGAPDPSFTPVSNINTGSTCLLLQPDGRVIMGGGTSTIPGPFATFGLWRFQPDGSQDPTLASLQGQNMDAVSAMVLQPDGQLVIGGRFGSINSNSQLSLARLTASSVLPVRAGAAAAEPALYPNPAHDRVVVGLQSAAGPRRVVLLDLLGRPVLAQALPSAARELTLALPPLPTGAYLLRVEYAQGSPVTHRLLVK